MSVENEKIKAIEQYGTEAVSHAEGIYETLPDKHFWSDLTSEERLSYINRAIRALRKDNTLQSTKLSIGDTVYIPYVTEYCPLPEPCKHCGHVEYNEEYAEDPSNRVNALKIDIETHKITGILFLGGDDDVQSVDYILDGKMYNNSGRLVLYSENVLFTDRKEAEARAAEMLEAHRKCILEG